MEQKTNRKKIVKPVTTIDDEKEYLKTVMPALAMPNTNPNSMIDELAGLIPKWNEAQAKSSRKRSRSGSRERKHQQRDRSRNRSKRHSRSRSPKYSRRSDQEYDRRKHRDRDKKPELMDEPVLQKVYAGRVNNITNFGAFVAVCFYNFLLKKIIIFSWKALDGKSKDSYIFRKLKTNA